ncbi:MAG: hypothetical protein L0332_05400 [Chloroflexi bacterium]|nr:hypothetical protein [Chloroflexota bacterium]MCI0579922.1 hypothetical protein [Chloroflexota bacterium]MCI0646505.1 hypothetical protein [Chloroflexota bacterium]MCI0726143.1 hypothetical protein [Chloroflexota bacterium]
MEELKVTKETKQPGFRLGNLLFGSALVIAGALFLLGNLFDIRVGHFIWPFFVMAPGAILLFLALVVEDPAGEPMAMVGSLITMVGLVLFYQNVTGHWESWSYAWALVAPTSIGLGQLFYGGLKNRPNLVQSGKNLVKVGVGIFLVGAFFFELIIGVSGFGRGRLFWPLALIAFGLYLLVRNLIPRGRKV